MRILDQGFHVDGMTREQAMEMMTRTAFQEEREAAGKWVRMQLSSAQLPTYFVGYQEWKDFRAAAEKRPGLQPKARSTIRRSATARRRCASSAS